MAKKKQRLKNRNKKNGAVHVYLLYVHLARPEMWMPQYTTLTVHALNQPLEYVKHVHLEANSLRKRAQEKEKTD